MGVAGSNGNCKSAAFALLVLYPDGSAVQVNQLLDKSQTDAGPLVGARLRSLDISFKTIGLLPPHAVSSLLFVRAMPLFIPYRPGREIVGRVTQVDQEIGHHLACEKGITGFMISSGTFGGTHSVVVFDGCDHE
jgi:hypothetical protein